MTKADALKHDRIRELILISLQPNYPLSMDSVVLRRHMATFGYPMTESDLMSYLAYLEEKCLVKIEKRGEFIVLARITAKGLDVLDNRIDEVGVGE